MNRTLLVLRILAVAQVMPWVLYAALAVVVSQVSLSRTDVFLLLILLGFPGVIGFLLGVASCLIALVACVRQRRWGWVTGLGLLLLLTLSALPSHLLGIVYGNLVGSQGGTLFGELSSRAVTSLIPGLALGLVALASSAGSRTALSPV